MGRRGSLPLAPRAQAAGRVGQPTLPPDQAEIILLRVVAGLPVEEVAAITGRRPGTVRVLQHRALRRLADRLAPGTGSVARNDRPVNGL